MRGSGGFATVYAGYDSHLDREVAIKVPSAKLIARDAQDIFMREARNLARLRHPGIVTVFDVGVEDGQCFIVSDLLDDPANVLDGLKHFRYRGTDVIVFHVLDPYELKFPFEHAARFRDMETAEEVMAVPGAVRDDYLERMQGMIAFYRRELGLTGIDYCLLDTSQPLELGLMSYLMTRKRVL